MIKMPIFERILSALHQAIPAAPTKGSRRVLLAPFAVGGVSATQVYGRWI